MSLLQDIRYYLTNKGKEVVGVVGGSYEGSLGLDMLRYLKDHGSGTSSQIARDVGPIGFRWSKYEIDGRLVELVEQGLIDFEVGNE